MEGSYFRFVIVKKWWLIKKYHSQIIGKNNEILFSSQNYFNKQDAIDTINVVKAAAYNAPIDFKEIQILKK